MCLIENIILIAIIVINNMSADGEYVDRSTVASLRRGVMWYYVVDACCCQNVPIGDARVEW